MPIFRRKAKDLLIKTYTNNMEQNKQTTESDGVKPNGVVTVNDENNPTREERDNYIKNEPDTDRLMSERESVERGKAGNNNSH